MSFSQTSAPVPTGQSSAIQTNASDTQTPGALTPSNITPAAIGASTAASSQANLRNVVIGGIAYTSLLPIAGSKTRFKGRRQYQFGSVAPTGGIQFAFCNWYLQLSSTAPEVANNNAITINQAAAVLNSTVVTLTQNGNASFTIPAGTAIFLTDPVYPQDFGLTVWPAGGLIEYRHQYDLTSGQNAPYDGSSQRPGTQAYRYIPADDPGGDIYATGALSLPTGSPDIVGIWFPSAIIGTFSSQSSSVALLGDSIVYGTGNNSAQPGSYGWCRSVSMQACQFAGIPFWSFGVSGLPANEYNPNPNGYISQMLKYCNTVFMMFGTNDLYYVQPGTTNTQQTALNVLAYMSARAQWVRSNGIRRVVVATIPPRMQNDSYRCTDLAHQVYLPTNAANGLGFEAGGQRDQLNAALIANPASAGADVCFDFAGGYCNAATDSSRWAVSTFSTTLSASSTAGAATISTAAAPTSTLPLLFTIDAGTGSYESGQLEIMTITGTSAPYTFNLQYTDSYSNTTLGIATGNNHSSGATLNITNTIDGTHPGVQVVIAARRALAQMLNASAPLG